VLHNDKTAVQLLWRMLTLFRIEDSASYLPYGQLTDPVRRTAAGESTVD
jgi:hypothetical protein